MEGLRGARVSTWGEGTCTGAAGEEGELWRSDVVSEVGIPAAEMGGTERYKEEVNEGFDHEVLSAGGEVAQEVREGMSLGNQEQMDRGMMDPSGRHWGSTVSSGRHLNRGEQRGFAPKDPQSTSPIGTLERLLIDEISQPGGFSSSESVCLSEVCPCSLCRERGRLGAQRWSL